MEIILEKKLLGLESFNVLGFNSEEELKLKISNLIKFRSEFEIKFLELQEVSVVINLKSNL